MPIDLPALPYSNDALSPFISAKTLSFHHGKHHHAYVTTLNKLVEGTDVANKSLADIVKLIVFVGILAAVGWMARLGLLPRTRPIVPGEWAISD